MRKVLELPRLSRSERDRRWGLVRGRMQERGLEAIVLWGWATMWDFYTANARYLCPVGGNAEFNVLVFPASGEPTCFVQMPTFVEGWRSAQDWVGDIRARGGTWADTVAKRIAELGLGNGNIGMDGLAGPLDPDGWLPHSVYVRLRELLPHGRLVEIGDMLEQVRAIKSAEEIDMLDRAAGLGDLMLQACRESARPGVKECEVYGRMVEVMLSNGGEEPSCFYGPATATPIRTHSGSRPRARWGGATSSSARSIRNMAAIFTHIERTFCLGEPDVKQREIYAGCVAAYERGLSLFGPGRKISETMEEVRSEIAGRGLAICETGIHGHGLASLEYPRYRHHALKADQGALKAIGDEFRPGMVFAFNIDLFDPKWRNGETGCVFAETIRITKTGACRMHGYPTELQVLAP